MKVTVGLEAAWLRPWLSVYDLRAWAGQVRLSLGLVLNPSTKTTFSSTSKQYKNKKTEKRV